MGGNGAANTRSNARRNTISKKAGLEGRGTGTGGVVTKRFTKSCVFGLEHELLDIQSLSFVKQHSSNPSTVTLGHQSQANEHPEQPTNRFERMALSPFHHRPYCTTTPPPLHLSETLCGDSTSSGGRCSISKWTRGLSWSNVTPATMGTHPPRPRAEHARCTRPSVRPPPDSPAPVLPTLTIYLALDFAGGQHTWARLE